MKRVNPHIVRTGPIENVSVWRLSPPVPESLNEKVDGYYPSVSLYFPNGLLCVD